VAKQTPPFESQSRRRLVAGPTRLEYWVRRWLSLWHEKGKPSTDSLGSRNRLNRDTFAIFASCTTATSNMATASQRSSVEAFLKLPAGLGFPCFDRHPVLLLNPVSVPFWNYVEAAEWNYSQIWSEIVNVTAFEPLLVFDAGWSGYPPPVDSDSCFRSLNAFEFSTGKSNGIIRRKDFVQGRQYFLVAKKIHRRQYAVRPRQVHDQSRD